MCFDSALYGSASSFGVGLVNLYGTPPLWRGFPIQKAGTAYVPVSLWPYCFLSPALEDDFSPVRLSDDILRIKNNNLHLWNDKFFLHLLTPFCFRPSPWLFPQGAEAFPPPLVLSVLECLRLYLCLMLCFPSENINFPLGHIRIRRRHMSEIVVRLRYDIRIVETDNLYLRFTILFLHR